MHIRFADRAVSTSRVSQRVMLDNGYMQAPGKVARAGTQRYVGADFDDASLSHISEQRGANVGPLDPIIVYRPPDVVFDPAVMAAFDNIDITIEHPADKNVDSKSYLEKSVGHSISAGRQEGDWMVVDLLIKAQKAIAAAQQGKVELSAGYDGEYQYAPGTTPDGEAYDLILTSITPNHIALCDTARAGHEARLADSKPNGVEPMKVRLADGQNVDVSDDNATLIQRSIDSAQQAAAAAQRQASEAEAERDALKDENETLKAKTADSAIAARVQEVTAVQRDAALLTGKLADSASIDPHAIRAAALEGAGIKCRYADSWKDADPAKTEARFDTEVERKQEEADADEDLKARTADSHSKLAGDAAQAFKANTADSASAREAGRSEYMKSLGIKR